MTDNKPIACIDGNDSLISLCGGVNELIKYLIANTYFFEPIWVRDYASKVNTDICNDTCVPIRYCSNKDNKYYKLNNVKLSYPDFKNKSEAIKFTNDQDKVLRSIHNNIRIMFDSDGNTATKAAIEHYSNHIVSNGELSTIKNYTIAHIWGKTDNPLFFSLMWNYCLVPNYLSQITDKNPATHEITRKVLEVLKAVSVEIYNPNQLMGRTVLSDDDMPGDNAITLARQLLAEGKIKYLKKI